MGFRTRAQFAEFINDTMANPAAVKSLGGGRTAYWNDQYQAVVVHNPRAADAGTVFQPKNGRAYFDNLR